MFALAFAFTFATPFAFSDALACALACALAFAIAFALAFACAFALAFAFPKRFQNGPKTDPNGGKNRFELDRTGLDRTGTDRIPVGSGFGRVHLQKSYVSPSDFACRRIRESAQISANQRKSAEIKFWCLGRGRLDKGGHSQNEQVFK